MYILSVRPTKRSSCVHNDIWNAPYDPGMTVRLANVNDLIASEGKYHLICSRVFERKIVKIKKGSSVHDLSFLWLCNELEYAAYQGIVLKLADVWNRYTELMREVDIIIPSSVSRRCTFKEKIEAKLGGIIQFYRRVHVELSDRHTIIITTRYQFHGISQLAEKVDDELSIPLYHPEKVDELSIPLYHPEKVDELSIPLYHPEKVDELSIPLYHPEKVDELSIPLYHPEKVDELSIPLYHPEKVDELSIPLYHPEKEDEFLALIHVALKIRSDVMNTIAKSKKLMEVRVDDASECIPESLHMFYVGDKKYLVIWNIRITMH